MEAVFFFFFFHFFTFKLQTAISRTIFLPKDLQLGSLKQPILNIYVNLLIIFFFLLVFIPTLDIESTECIHAHSLVRAVESRMERERLATCTLKIMNVVRITQAIGARKMKLRTDLAIIDLVTVTTTTIVDNLPTCGVLDPGISILSTSNFLKFNFCILLTTM